MIVSLIKIIFLINCLVSFSYGATRLVCKRGVKKVILVNGKKRVVCVVKRTKVSTPAPKPSPLEWSARWWGKLASRTEGTPFFASNRYRLEAEAEKGVASWTKIVLGGRVTHDLMSQIQGEEYRDDFSQNGKPDWELWNAYLDFNQNSWRLRLGQQQVAWGEAFGFFYADIVNPKDFRERGLGKLADLRLPVPMANLQWIAKSISIQGLWVPSFKSNRSPTAKSDFFPESSVNVSLPPGITLDTNSTYKLDDEVGNFGGRVSGTILGVDLSVLYYDHIDPQPYYLPDTGIPSGSRFLLRPHHNRIQSSALTFSTDFDGIIIRSENVYTPSRRLNTFSGGVLSYEEASQRVHVLGVDFPRWNKLNIGIQGSIDTLDTNEDILFRNRELSLLSARLGLELRKERWIELLLSAETYDFSGMIQAKYIQPISSSHEFELGSDIFTGPVDTFFGQTSQATRIYFLVKGTI